MCVTVRDKFSRDSCIRKDTLLEELHDFFTSHVLLARNQDDCLSTPLVSYREDQVRPSGLWQFDHKVHGDCKEGHVPFFGGDGMEWGYVLGSDGFVLLANGAAFNIVSHVLSQSWPPIVPFDGLPCFPNTWVSCCDTIVIVLQDVLVESVSGGHDQGAVFVECLVDFFAVVNAFPLLPDVLVL